MLPPQYVAILLTDTRRVGNCTEIDYEAKALEYINTEISRLNQQEKKYARDFNEARLTYSANLKVFLAAHPDDKELESATQHEQKRAFVCASDAFLAGSLIEARKLHLVYIPPADDKK